MIPFLDLKGINGQYRNELIEACTSVIDSGSYIRGEQGTMFEAEFSEFCGTKYCVGVGNGLDALSLVLRAWKELGMIKDGDEVIVPANTYIASILAITENRLVPVLVEPEPLTYNIDVTKISSVITSKTKVIMPVHLYGSVANLASIKKIIGNKKIYLIDDCAQAHGAYDDSENRITKRIGSAADISCFSLYPGKNLGAYGDAGIITTNNKKFFKIIRQIRNLGAEKKFMHEHVGINSRLDSLQAIILNKKIKNLNNLNKKRRIIAKFYKQEIKNSKIEKLIYSKTCVYHQYVILTRYRNKLITLLKKNKIQFGFHYPFAIHQLKIFKKKFGKDRFKNSEKIAKQGISIPIDPNLKKSEIIKICKVINSL